MNFVKINTDLEQCVFYTVTKKLIFLDNHQPLLTD